MMKNKIYAVGAAGVIALSLAACEADDGCAIVVIGSRTRWC